MRTKDRVGTEGEDVAAAYLQESGMVVLARNWRCPAGEIDIVAADGECLVVCEVKTRRSTAFGSPSEAVTPAKLARLRRLCALWLAAHDGRWSQVRIDVVGILRPPQGPDVVEHLRGVGG